MDNCIFCKIIRNESPSVKVYEDESVLSFMVITPISRGHVLVIPKKHTENILETDDATLADLAVKTKKIAEATVKAVNADGLTVSTNKGEAAGQTVFHIHYHIIPRFKGDNLKPWPHQDAELKTREDIAAAIKKNL